MFSWIVNVKESLAEHHDMSSFHFIQVATSQARIRSILPLNFGTTNYDMRYTCTSSYAEHGYKVLLFILPNHTLPRSQLIQTTCPMKDHKGELVPLCLTH